LSENSANESLTALDRARRELEGCVDLEWTQVAERMRLRDAMP